jgi:hypothetical protein
MNEKRPGMQKSNPKGISLVGEGSAKKAQETLPCIRKISAAESI